MKNNHHVKVKLNRHGLGIVQLDGKDVDAIDLEIKAAVRQVPTVRLTLYVNEIETELDDAKVEVTR